MVRGDLDREADTLRDRNRSTSPFVRTSSVPARNGSTRFAPAARYTSQRIAIARCIFRVSSSLRLYVMSGAPPGPARTSPRDVSLIMKPKVATCRYASISSMKRAPTHGTAIAVTSSGVEPPRR